MHRRTRKSCKNLGATVNDFPWAAVISGLIAASVGIVTSLWARKSQSEANKLTGSHQVVQGYDTLTNQVQEERDRAVLQLSTEREQNKADISLLRAEFEAFKSKVQSQFSQYRAYIHQLRGQVHELGGVPHEWPKDLDQ